MVDAPIRIQRSRAKGWRMPPNTVYVGRPTRWGNPILAGTFFRDFGPVQVVRTYRGWLTDDPGYRSWWGTHGRPPALADVRAALAGKNLCCWCAIGQPCHADVLLEVANQKGDAP